MIKKKLFLIFYFSSIYFLLYGQKSNLIFTSKNDLKFKLSLNNIEQHFDFTTNLTILMVEDNQNYMVKIVFENDTTNYKQSIYIVDANTSNFYEVTKSKIILKKILFDKYLPKKTEQNVIVAYISAAEIMKDTLIPKNDTVTIDTTYKVPFDNYYKMPDYNGKIGCPFPIKPEQLNEVLLQLQQLNLDDRKMNLVKDFKEKNIDFCLTMEQTQQVISKFELDENKSEIVKFLYPFIYDQDNLLFLKPSFNYENTYDELKLYFGI